jgi:hypothetical protein
MTYFIHARDGAGRVILKRDTEEATLKKAAELKLLGWFEVELIRDKQAPSRAT